MTEAGANEELFSLIIVSNTHTSPFALMINLLTAYFKFRILCLTGMIRCRKNVLIRL